MVVDVINCEVRSMTLWALAWRTWLPFLGRRLKSSKPDLYRGSKPRDEYSVIGDTEISTKAGAPNP